jgi:hypothetical protein
MDQFALQYGKLRASVLSRHFALNKRFRSNFFFQTNSLQGLPATEADRWRIVNHGGDNPLMTSGQLMTCLAVEHHLGSPDAARILRVLLQTIGSLYKFSGNHFDGYILRWDPVIYEGEWRDDSRSRYSKAFYINDDGTYNYSTPLQDPRSRRLFSEAEWNVATPEERNNRGDDYWQWLSRYRRWEVSMDELVGLVMGYDTVHRLVAVDDIRAEVSTQANKLGDYLAEHGYYLVRPSGGFNARGGSGILPALEYPFSRVFARITGEPYYIRNGFQAVMEKADVWKALEGPLNAWSVTGLAVGALLTYLFGFINAVIVSLGLEALFGTTTPFTPAQLGQIWAIYSHRDVFDVWSATNADRYDRNAAGEFALAYALSLLSLRRRFDDYMNGAQGGETEKWATQFPPFLGLTGLDDSEPNVRDAYLNWLRGRRNRGDLSDDDMSRSAFASAVAVVLAQGAEEDARLVQLLKQSLSWNDVPVVDSEESGGKALEYLCALSLAWLHRKRMQERGESIATADFPELPGLADLQSWPAASVPASVLNEARAGAVAVPLDVIQRSNPRYCVQTAAQICSSTIRLSRDLQSPRRYYQTRSRSSFSIAM